MQVRFFTVPVSEPGATAELNAFLASRRVLEVRSEFVSQGTNSFWSLLVSYLDGEARTVGDPRKPRVDYKEVLGPEEFAVFALLREWRKETATAEGVPAYAIFTDEELAGIARLGDIRKETLREVPGIGEKKAARYGDALAERLRSRGKGTP